MKMDHHFHKLSLMSCIIAFFSKRLILYIANEQGNVVQLTSVMIISFKQGENPFRGC